MKFFGLIFSTVIFLCCNMALAQQAPQNSQNPIEITASKDVEWQRNNQKYIARENVVVTQGNMSISCDLLTADYRDGATSSNEIYQMTAEGSVVIADDKNKAFGDLAVYDVTQGIATLTGSNLKLVSPDQTITARDKMEYFSNERKARAVGNAKVVRAQDTLSADNLTAFFKDENAATNSSNTTMIGGGNNLDRLEAQGNVIIKTPTETLYGDKAVYKADTNIAELIGNVRVERDKNVLEGARAEVNLNTNISKMMGDGKKGDRVRGVFFPSSQKPTNSNAPVPAPVLDPAPTPNPAEQAPKTSSQTPPLAPELQGVRVSPAITY